MSFYVMSFQEKITGNSATFFSLSVLKKVWSLPITRENKRNCNGDCPWMTKEQIAFEGNTGKLQTICQTLNTQQRYNNKRSTF